MEMKPGFDAVGRAGASAKFTPRLGVGYCSGLTPPVLLRQKRNRHTVAPVEHLADVSSKGDVMIAMPLQAYSGHPQRSSEIG